MSNEHLCIDDRRGLIFTINRESSPVYQVESKHWAHAANRWSQDEIPPEILATAAELEAAGQPGAFARFIQGDVGVYVIYEKNIKNLPEAAGQERVIQTQTQTEGERALSAYDIVICAKEGEVCGEDGTPFQTQDGEYYVNPCDTWARFVLDPANRPSFVETTKEILLLLEDLHGKNFLSMSPDKPHEHLPSKLGEPLSALAGINCYVLNLARFER